MASAPPTSGFRVGIEKRWRALRRAGRTFSWMVIRPTPKRSLSRWVSVKLAASEAWCGLLSGGDHSWGPLRFEYDGARWRKRKCRWCKARMTPAEEFDRNPLSEEELQSLPKIRKPTEADAERAVQLAREHGILRGDKWLWD